MSDLETRVRRLERWNRGLALLVVVMGATALIAANAAPERLTVRGLTVVDDQGRTRASIACGDDDVSFALLDPAGNQRIVSACDADGLARQELRCAKGKFGVRLLCNAEAKLLSKSDGIELTDTVGDRAVMIRAYRENGGPEIRIKDVFHNGFWRAPSGAP